MDRYVCTICGYVYDPEQGDPDNGVAPGTPFAVPIPGALILLASGLVGLVGIKRRNA